MYVKTALGIKLVFKNCQTFAENYFVNLAKRTFQICCRNPFASWQKMTRPTVGPKQGAPFLFTSPRKTLGQVRPSVRGLGSEISKYSHQAAGQEIYILEPPTPTHTHAWVTARNLCVNTVSDPSSATIVKVPSAQIHAFLYIIILVSRTS